MKEEFWQTVNFWHEQRKTPCYIKLEDSVDKLTDGQKVGGSGQNDNMTCNNKCTKVFQSKKRLKQHEEKCDLQNKILELILEKNL